MPFDPSQLYAQLQPFQPAAPIATPTTDEPTLSPAPPPNPTPPLPSEPAQCPEPELVEILVPGGAPIREAAAKLYAVLKQGGQLMLRGGVVVELGRRDGGKVCIVPVTAAGARSRFEVGVAWVRMTANGPRPAILSEDMAKALLEAREHELLPRLEGLVAAPMLIEKAGQLVALKPGYNPDLGLLVLNATEAAEVTLEDAIEALSETLLGEYEFATPSDKARALAGALTPALNLARLLPGRIGLVVIEANDSQTGKGFFVRLVAALYGEVPSCFAKASGGVGGFDESLDHALIWGRPIISIENVRGPVGSQKLESFLTEPTYQARIPYAPAMEIDPTRFVVFLTSNGAEFTTDLANRSLLVRIRKRTGHRFRHFPEGDLLAHVTARRPFFLGCVFAVIRAWHAAGKPRTDDVRHSKRDWVQVCDWIVQNLFHLPPLLDGHTQVLDRAAMRFLGFVRQLAIILERRGRLGKDHRPRNFSNMRWNIRLRCRACELAPSWIRTWVRGR